MVVIQIKEASSPAVNQYGSPQGGDAQAAAMPCYISWLNDPFERTHHAHDRR
jgi:hypothetical protein